MFAGGAPLSEDENAALAMWLAMAQQDGCACLSAATLHWKRRCGIMRAAPIFCPFSRPTERVALVDFAARGPPPAPQPLAERPGGPEPRGTFPAPAQAASWTLLPDACPEVRETMRAVGVDLPTCVEIVQPAREREAVATLLRELALPQLTWAQVLQDHVFPWAAGATDPAARQGLMLAVVHMCV